MWQRFTERARRVVFFAQEEAGALGENYVSSEHLLLGMVRESDNIAALILSNMGIEADAIRAEILKQVNRIEGVTSKDMQLTPRSKKIIDFAYEEAKLLENSYIGTEHLLLGMLREGEGLAGRTLMRFGVELEAVRAVVRQLQDNSTSPEDQAALAKTPGLLAKLHTLKEAIQNIKTEPRYAESGPLDAKAPSAAPIERGNIGVLKTAANRPKIEFVPALLDVADFEDVMRVQDEYAYREMVQAGKIVLLEAGTQAKYLGAGAGLTYLVRILDGLQAGQLGYTLRTALQEIKRDDRPFPPTIEEESTG